jgi:hypothetical protein
LGGAGFLVAHLEQPNRAPRALPRAKTGSGAAANETETDPKGSILPELCFHHRIELAMLNIAHGANHQHFGTASNEADKHLPPEVSQSFNYQILRRTLMAGSDAPDAQAAAREITAAHSGVNSSTSLPASQSPNGADSASSSTVDVALQSRDFVEVIQQRELNLQLNVKPVPKKTDPLALDLAGNGFSTRGLDDSISFDLDGDGQLERISAPSGDDALLALDRNANGRIDNGRELFGDQHGASNGFAELSNFDDNHDGRIDLQDSVFAHLSLLRFDQHGQQQRQSLSAAGISAIDLHAQNVQQALGAYDEIAQLGQFEFDDGRRGQAADLLLASY